MQAYPNSSVVRRMASAALMLASLGVARLAYGQCPSTIPQSVLNSIATPDVRAAAAAVRIDQPFLASHGGARAVLENETGILAAIDSQILQARDCRDAASNAPGRTTAGNNMGGSCVAALQKLEEGRRGQEAAVHLLQCWAGQAVGGTAAARAPARGLQEDIEASCGKPPVPPAVRDTDPRARSLRAAYETNRDAYTTCSDRVMNVRYATGAPGFGPFGGAVPTGAASSTPLGDNLSALGSALGSLLASRPNVPPPDLSGIGPEADARRQAAATSARPLLEASPGGAGVNATLVDDVLKGGVDDSPRQMPFTYDTPRTDPKDGFWKRISGAFHSDAGRYALDISVRDIDGNWLTTDECAVVDVTVRMTIDVRLPDGSASQAVQDITQSVDAPNGLADVTVPVTFNQRGVVSDVRVTRADIRGCGKENLPVNCADSDEAQLSIGKAYLDLLAKSAQLDEGLTSLEADKREFDDMAGAIKSGTTEALVITQYAGAVAKVYLSLVNLAYPAILKASELATVVVVERSMSLGKDVGAAGKTLMDGRPINPSATAIGIANNVNSVGKDLNNRFGVELPQMFSGLAPYVEKLSTVTKVLSGLTGFADSLQKVQEFRDAKQTADSVSVSLGRQIAQIRSKLSAVSAELKILGSEYEKLRSACSGQ